MRLRTVGLIVVVLMLAGAHTTHAQPADDRELRARKLFGVGKYAEALEIYSELYAETAHPTYVRNIGRCYQNMGEPEKAISSFREYLRQSADLSPSQRAQIEGYIKEMDDLRMKRQNAPASSPSGGAPAIATPPKASPASPNASPAPPNAGPARAKAAETPSPPSAARAAPAPNFALVAAPAAPSGPRVGGRRSAAYAVAGLSLVALGMGGFFGVRAIMKEHDSQKLCPTDPCTGEGLSLNNDARSAARVADVAIGAGLVGAGVTAYLLFTSRDRKPPPSDTVAHRLRLTPEVGPSRAGVLVEARW